SNDKSSPIPVERLERIPQGKGDEIGTEVSRRIDILHCAGRGVLVVTVVVPTSFPGPGFREVVVDAAIGMQPFRIQRPGNRPRDQCLWIQPKLTSTGSRQVGADMHRKPTQ